MYVIEKFINGILGQKIVQRIPSIQLEIVDLTLILEKDILGEDS